MATFAGVIDLGIDLLYDKQFNAFFSDATTSCTEASTKSGKTHAAMAWITEQAINGPKGVEHWWVAPTYDQAAIAWKRMDREYKNMPWVKKSSDASGYLQIILFNDAIIRFRSGEKPNNLYGEDVYSLVIDEASRLKEQAWVACRSTITATEGPMRLIGNVHGRGWYWQMCRRLEERPDSDESFHRITWRDAVEAGVLTKESIDKARRDMTEKDFQELYEAIASEGSGNPFGYDHIKACVGPMSTSDPVAFGVDLGKAVSYTVVIGLDMEGKVCRFARWRNKSWHDTINRIRAVIGTTRAYVDSTGVGDPVIEFLRHGRMEQRGLSYFRQSATEAIDFAGLALSDFYNRIIDFNFNRKSKQQLMEGLTVAIQHHLLQIPNGPIRDELDSFHVEETANGERYKAPDGYYDDCVDSLALAVECWTNPGVTWEVVS